MSNVVTVFQRFLRRSGSEKTDASRGIWTVVGHRSFPEQSFHDRRGEELGGLLQFIGRVQRAPPRKNGDLFPDVYARSARLPDRVAKKMMVVTN